MADLSESPDPGQSDRSDLHQRTREYYRLVDADDLDGVLDWFADDAVYYRPGYDPIRGRQELRAFYGGERVIASGQHVLESVLGDGRSVAVRGRFEGTLKDGSAATVGFADFIDYDDQQPARVRQRRSYFDSPAV